MKKATGRLFLIALTMVMAVSLLAGCGPKKPAPEDAQAYVKAVLDVICLGDYDHSVNLVDIEEGEEGALREGVIDEMLDTLGGDSGLNDEVKSKFKACLIDAFAKSRYTVGDAVATDDGGYDVTVSVEPLQLFAGFSDNFENIVQEKAMAEYDKVMAMTEVEQNNWVMDILIDMINDNLADPKYDPPEEVTVHYGLMDEENNVYGCTAEEGEKLGEKLFSQTGME